MTLTGRCHCDAIHYELSSDVMHHALCHCSDYRRHASAPMVGWAMSRAENVKIHGEPKSYSSSENGRRHFCGKCGTSLFYTNAVVLPGIIDVQSGTLERAFDDRGVP
jgi:hypothetical protein